MYDKLSGSDLKLMVIHGPAVTSTTVGEREVSPCRYEF